MFAPAKLAVVVALAGCALTKKAPPLDVRYYALQSAPAEQSSPPSETKIRLGRVTAGSHLRSRIAFRASPVEIEFYETRRWTEPPEEYVRRALERALVEQGVLVTGGTALQLQVEVIAFEEVRGPPTGGRVMLRYVLIDNRTVVREGVIESVRPAGDDFSALVVAIGRALDDASESLVSEAVNEAISLK